jgi:hypothetical protein
MTLRLEPPANVGCPILAAFLFLRLGWETSNLNGSSVRGKYAQ